MMIRVALVTVLAAVAVVPEPSTAGDRVLRTEMILPASVEQVWTLWTTEAGLTSFFARGSRIEPRVDGVCEILFNPSAPPGSRGAEGLRILAFEPPKRRRSRGTLHPISHMPELSERWSRRSG